MKYNTPVVITQLTANVYITDCEVKWNNRAVTTSFTVNIYITDWKEALFSKRITHSNDETVTGC